MPNFCANLTLMFNEVEFLDRFDAAAKAGFKGVEYLFPYVAPAAQVAEKLNQAKLTQILHNLPAGNWAAGDRGNAVLELAHAVGLHGVAAIARRPVAGR